MNDYARVKEIPVDSIITAWFNPRKTFDPEHIKELADSIRRDGLWDPIIVRRKSNHYELIAGECRLRAAKKLGLRTIEARVLDVDDEEASLLALKTNLMRRDLNPIEEAYGIKKLIEMGWSVEKIAEKLGKSQTWVYQRLKLAEDATEGLKNAIIQQLIPVTYAIKLSELPKGLQGPAVEKVIKERLNFKETQVLVDLLRDAKTPERLELIFTTPPEKILKRDDPTSPSSERYMKEVTVIECECGIKYIVDWKNHHVISERHQKV